MLTNGCQLWWEHLSNNCFLWQIVGGSEKGHLHRIFALQNTFQFSRCSERDVVSLSRMHLSTFSNDQQLHCWCFVIRLSMCQWVAASSRWCHGRLFLYSLHMSLHWFPIVGSQSGLGIISFQFMQTFNQNFLALAEHHYLQTLSDISIASFPSLLLNGK